MEKLLTAKEAKELYSNSSESRKEYLNEELAKICSEIETLAKIGKFVYQCKVLSIYEAEVLVEDLRELGYVVYYNDIYLSIYWDE